jgi:hypothetical protein
VTAHEAHISGQGPEKALHYITTAVSRHLPYTRLCAGLLHIPTQVLVGYLLAGCLEQVTLSLCASVLPAISENGEKLGYVISDHDTA